MIYALNVPSSGALRHLPLGKAVPCLIKPIFIRTKTGHHKDGRFCLRLCLFVERDIAEVDVLRCVDLFKDLVFKAGGFDNDVVLAHGKILEPEVTVFIG